MPDWVSHLPTQSRAQGRPLPSSFAQCSKEALGGRKRLGVGGCLAAPLSAGTPGGQLLSPRTRCGLCLGSCTFATAEGDPMGDLCV